MIDIAKLAREALVDDQRATPRPWTISERAAGREPGRSVDVDFLPSPGGNVACDTAVEDGEWIVAARTREPLLAAEVLRLMSMLDAIQLTRDNEETMLLRTRAERDELNAQLVKTTAAAEDCNAQRVAAEHALEATKAKLAAMAAARDEACDISQLALEALEDDNRVTPGPWTTCRAQPDAKCPCRLIWSIPVDMTVVSASEEGTNEREGGDVATPADLCFIATARTREPLLAAEVLRLRAAQRASADALAATKVTLAAVTAARDELAGMASERLHPPTARDRRDLARVAELRAVGKEPP